MSDTGPVRVRVGGEELTIRSDMPADYTRSVAEYFDDAIRRIRAMHPTIEAHKAAILAGFSITDELLKARADDAVVASRLAAMADDAARLLPPAKRTPRPGTTD